MKLLIKIHLLTVTNTYQQRKKVAKKENEKTLLQLLLKLHLIMSQLDNSVYCGKDISDEIILFIEIGYI